MSETPDRYMSSSELAATLTRMEVAMVRSIEGFGRWSAALNRIAIGAALSAPDVWLLHGIRMRGGVQNLSELLLFLNRTEISTIQYSLRKLEQWGLVERVHGNSKREAGYRLTTQGEAATADYAATREKTLVELLAERNVRPEAMQATANILETMTGFYDQTTQLVVNRKVLGI